MTGPNLTVISSHDEQKPRLTDAHREHLRTSGLTDDTMDLAGFVSLNKRSAAKVLGRSRYDSVGIAIPFHLPGSEKPKHYRFRPDEPRTYKKPNGEGYTAKYDQKKGTPPLVYFPPRTLSSEGLQSDEPCVITEGEKTGCAVDQLGYPTVALTGVWNGHDVKHKKATGKRILHPWILKYVRVRGRTFILLFDADSTSNDKVKQALQALTTMLYEAGAACVKIATIEPTADDPKRGADDVLAAGPASRRRG